MITAIRDIQNLLEQIKKGDITLGQKVEEANRLCQVMDQECRKGIPEKLLATNNQGYETLVELFKMDEPMVMTPAMKALASLLDGNPDPLEAEGFKVSK